MLCEGRWGNAPRRAAFGRFLLRCRKREAPRQPGFLALSEDFTAQTEKSQDFRLIFVRNYCTIPPISIS